MPICEFGKNVKKKLVDIEQTQEWLIEQVGKDTGMFIDSGYLQKIFSGKRHPAKIISSIQKILKQAENEVINEEVHNANRQEPGENIRRYRETR